MDEAVILLARGAGRLSRTLGRGGGTSLPGRLLVALRPGAVERLSGRLAGGSVAISGTNGKTTTARLVAAGLRSAGRGVVANTAGANLLSGVASTLLQSRAGDVGVFEVDEFALADVVSAIAPRAVLLMNLFRDQLDRYGELETIAERWHAVARALPGGTTLVVNADDPLVYDVGTGRPGTLTFGIEDTTHALSALPDAADSVRCRRCGSTLAYSAVLIAHLGHWACEACGWSRPTPDVRVTSAALAGPAGTSVEIETPRGPVAARLGLPGLHNVSNAAAATALLVALDCPLDAIGDALATTRAAFGRAERVQLDGREIVLLLAKNPTGANENVRTILLDAPPYHLLVCLNDRAADGRDVSWIWDVDYEPLLAAADGLTVSGTRAAELALRAKYAGRAPERIAIETSPAAALDRAIAATPRGGRLYVLPTYTALLDLRGVLQARGATGAFWEGGA